MEMENRRSYRAHILLIPYPSLSHINPLLQFSNRLASKGIKATLATTIFISNTMNLKSSSSSSSVHFETISDGFDEGGSKQSPDTTTYLRRLEVVGSKTLAELIERHEYSMHPIDCIVYDLCMPWVVDVAKEFGILGAAFATQPCTVNFLYYCLHRGLLKYPFSSNQLSIPGLSFLELNDMPCFHFVGRLRLEVLEVLMKQFSNVEKADFLLVNTVYGFEKEVVDSMSKLVTNLLTVGPTIPSIFLDKRIKDDNEYGVNPITTTISSSSAICSDWLNKKPAGSVVYVSFGSTPYLKSKQMEELALGLKNTNFHFLWSVSASEHSKLPTKFLEEISDNKSGLIVKWSPQLEVLSNEAVGCFVTHCGWNSTIEALSLGVPMVAMPQWTDQTTNAKLIEDLWKVGVRVGVDEDGIAMRDEIEFSIREVMEGKRGRQIKLNANKWRNMAIEAISQGGTSDNNIDEFLSKLTCF